MLSAELLRKLNAVKTPSELMFILRQLSPDQCSAVCQTMPELISRIIGTREDMISVANDLESQRFQVVCDALQTSLLDILNIKTPDDLSHIFFRVHTEENCNILLDAIPIEWVTFIKKPEDLHKTLYPMTPKKCTAVLAALGNSLPNIIGSGLGVWQVVISMLSPEKHAAVFKAIFPFLPQIIKKGDDLGYAMHDLTLEERAEVFAQMRPHLRDIIKTAWDFRYALEQLTLDQRTVILETITMPVLLKMIEKAEDYRHVVYYLTPAQRTG